MVGARIYFEGDRDLRPGFAAFFRGLSVPQRPKFIGCGGRENAIDNFVRALVDHADEHVFLLIDSEGPYSKELLTSACKLVPRSARERVFWMVHAMEAWFIADIETLETYYSGKLYLKELKAAPEEIRDPKSRLKHAVRNCGGYEEVRDGVSLLFEIRPDKVCAACPHCADIFQRIPKLAAAPKRRQPQR